jgi:hypothetical protein
MIIQNLNATAQHLTEAVEAIYQHRAKPFEAIDKASHHLEAAGININDRKVFDQVASFSKGSDVVKISNHVRDKASFAAGDNNQMQGYVGATRLDILNETIRQFFPEVSMDDNPLNGMLPSKVINAGKAEQGIYGAGYGMLQPSGAVKGVMNQIPLLERDAVTMRGYDFDGVLTLDGDAALAVRDLTSSDTTKNGSQELLNFSLLSAINMANMGVIGRGLESIKAGAYSATRSGVVVSSGIPSGNVFFVSGAESAGTYTKSTNNFAGNLAYPGDPIQQLMFAVNKLINLGIVIDSIEMDNQMYLWMFSTPAVKGQTKYSSAVSVNQMQDIQSNVFKINTIPALMGIPIEVYKQGYKFGEGATATTLNTRPLWWGETVTPSSFRVLIKTRSPLGSPIGHTIFPPNVYRDGMMSSDASTGLVIRAQDNSAVNMFNQSYDILVATTVGYVYYQPNAVYTVDFNVIVNN